MMNELIQKYMDDRLLTAASLVRDNAVIADIGTDHAYLPVYLLARGRARFAVASDIHKGPLERARQNAERFGVTEKMRFALADGLDGIEPEREGVTDIVLCGMGGELIARILDRSDYTRREGVRLVMQPMSAGDDLRAYLDGAGYRVLDEVLCKAAGKIYCCISAEYDGAVRQSTAAERLLGKETIAKREPLFPEYAEGFCRRLRTQIGGRRQGGLDTAAEENCLCEICRILEE